MSKRIISACHSLELVPTGRFTRFVRVDSRVIISMVGSGVDAHAIPGTIKLTTSAENGVNTKSLTYNRAGVSPEVTERLERCRSRKIVAIYTDESGRRRVCGSPGFPLSFEYIEKEGVYSVTLTGKDCGSDGFLE